MPISTLSLTSFLDFFTFSASRIFPVRRSTFINSSIVICPVSSFAVSFEASNSARIFAACLSSIRGKSCLAFCVCVPDVKPPQLSSEAIPCSSIFFSTPSCCINDSQLFGMKGKSRTPRMRKDSAALYITVFSRSLPSSVLARFQGPVLSMYWLVVSTNSQIFCRILLKASSS